VAAAAEKHVKGLVEGEDLALVGAGLGDEEIGHGRTSVVV